MVAPKACLLVGCAMLLPYAGASDGSHSLSGMQHQFALSYEDLNSSLDHIIDRGYLKVGTTGDYKPFTYLVTNKSDLANSSLINTTYIGADIEMAQSLANALSLPHPVEFVPTVWANITSDLLAGNFDIAMGGVSVTTARAKTAFFSNGILPGGKTACIRCEDTDKFTDLASIDVKGVTVVVNPGGTNEIFDRANLQHAKILLVEDNNAVYDAVLNGKADAMISDSIEIELQVKLHKGKLCTLDGEPLFTYDQKAYMMRRDVPWQNFVNTWVSIEVGSGDWNATLQQWMDYAWPAL